MSTPENSVPQSRRAARLAAWRRAIEITGADESLPFPNLAPYQDHIRWYADSPGALSALEAALDGGAPAASGPDGDGTHWVSEGTVLGYPAKITALIERVAQRRPTGQVVEVVDWVRLPAEFSAADEDGAA